MTPERPNCGMLSRNAREGRSRQQIEHWGGNARDEESNAGKQEKITQVGEHSWIGLSSRGRK